MSKSARNLLNKVAVAGPVYQFLREGWWHVKVPCNINDLFNDIARMAAAQLEAVLLIKLRLDIIYNDGIVDNVLASAVVLEDFLVLLQSRVLKMNLVTNAPEKRLVDEFLRS